MKLSDIKHEATNGLHYVAIAQNSYTVFMPSSSGTHAISDSSYELTDDGLSIAIARCNYIAKRYDAKQRDTHGERLAAFINAHSPAVNAQLVNNQIIFGTHVGIRQTGNWGVELHTVLTFSQAKHILGY